MKLLNKSLFLIALLSLALFTSPLVRAEDDIEEVEDEDVIVDEEGNANEEEIVDTQTAAETEADEETAEEMIKSSPYAKTNILFIQPEISDLPAGRLVKMLIGFQNNGTSDFVVEALEGSFRYPQDFSYYIQNFTTYDLNNRVIESEKEATFEYLFTPSETFSSRQFGLTINLRYRNAEGKSFVTAVYNETVNIVEPDEGLDGETFFLYIFLAALCVLALFGVYQFIFVLGKKKGYKSKQNGQSGQKLSNGSSTNSGEVDYEWIPQSHLQSNKLSPKVSPRQRKTKNGAPLSAGGNSSNDEQ